MGQFSLIFVLAAFLISGFVVYNSTRSTDRADEKVFEHQHRVLARDAASTGMAATVRRLGEQVNTGWAGTSFAVTNVAFDGGTYSVETAANTCSLLNAANQAVALAPYEPKEEWIEVRSTGTYRARIGAREEHRHEIVACFVRSNWGLFTPPAFNYGFLSDQNATFNGGTVESYVDGEGHIHANGDVTIRPQTVIDGHVTYTGDDNIHHRATVASHGTGSTVPMPAFDADAFMTQNGITPAACSADPNKCLFSSGFNPGGDMEIKPPVTDPGHRADNPFIWFVDGSFTLTGTTHIKVPQHTIIVVTGNISIGGSASVTVTGTSAQDCGCTNAQWVQSQLLGGDTTPLGWYVGKVDGNGDPLNGDVTINGSASIVGNFYANGETKLNGGGTGMNTVGSFASKGGLVVNGGAGSTKTNFWFVEVSEKNVIPGISLPGKQVARIALAEWTAPVLDNRTP